MASIQKTASVDFHKGTIIVKEGSDSRTTTYNSRASEEQMLVHIVALNYLGFSIHIQNGIENFEKKFLCVKSQIDEDQLARILSTLSINKGK